jgi:hypothetical protein
MIDTLPQDSQASAQSIAWNNQGALLIQNSDFFAAIVTLQAALRACRQWYREEPSPEHTTGDARRGQKVREGLPPPLMMDDYMTSSLRPCTSGEGYSIQEAGSDHHDEVSDNIQNGQADENLNGFVYQHPIFLSGNVQSHLGNNWIVAISIVFNLAIAHHRVALDHLKSSQKNPGNTKRTRMGVQVSLMHEQVSDDYHGRIMLQKAANLYQTLFPMMQRAEPLVGGGLFTTAVLNNLGKVHQALGQDDHARHYFHQLLSALMYVRVVSSSNDTGGRSTDGLHLWDAFFSNTAPLIFPKSSSAASAA